ncbi:hypothetical protein KSD_47740 [Ktedonobacter sp. SOSP1-85]|uniref:helix-turn-helix transcriptional regulator n=1 Tax=Ktedonobacter sp. SOSP1-85 TaxID=2778367 RepID=UPI0019155E5B|nr:helix-turn-helix transcriptional regulator [Ktedonobacter sp. SOSP1-85]GHO77003.1 hypothetical protein KSD_47740 [Ktedonobacter sp. SOSP1-85]
MSSEISGIHQGGLVARYRKHMNMSQQDLADAMHVSLRTVQRLEKEAVIEDLNRRRFLVALLGIPATYMGLNIQQQAIDEALFLFNDDPMTFLEDMVANRWKTHLMGGPLSASQGLERFVKEVETFSQKMQGKQWHHRAHVQLCMVYQLWASVAGDMMLYDKSRFFYQKAFSVAKELNDVELMASIRVREGVLFMRKEEPLKAITHLQNALELVNGQGLYHLRGNTLAMLSEAYAKSNQSQACWRSVGLAENALQQRSQVKERNYRIFSPSLVAAHKGVDALLLRDYDRAIALIDKGLKTYNPTLTPGRARLLARKAEAYYGKREIEDCCLIAHEALDLAKAVGASNTITRLQNLHVSLSQSPWKKEPGVIHLGIALTADTQ